MNAHLASAAFVRVPQEGKHSVTLWPRNSTPSMYPRELKIFTQKLLQNIHGSIILNSPNVKINKMSIKWKNKICYIHIMKYYL